MGHRERTGGRPRKDAAKPGADLPQVSSPDAGPVRADHRPAGAGQRGDHPAWHVLTGRQRPRLSLPPFLEAGPPLLESVRIHAVSVPQDRRPFTAAEARAIAAELVRAAELVEAQAGEPKA